MRVLYVGRSRGVHDRRFIEAWAASGAEVVELFVDGAEHDPATRVELALRDAAPDLVQVGPTTSPGAVVARLWHGPLIATSWGFDLMHDVDVDDTALAQATAVLQRADRVFVDNDGPARRARELGAAADSLISFPWGVDQRVFTLDGPGVRDPHHVVSVRRHDAAYRVGDVLEAFVLAVSADDRLRLTLAGTGPLTDELRARAAEAGIADRVDWPGELGAEALAELLRSSGLYVSSSPIDGSSVSLLEAMACGAPVVVTDIEGNRQWVDESTGWTFPPGDVTALAGLMVRLAGDAVEAGSRRDAALERVRSGADWAATAARFPEFAAAAIAAAAERHRVR